MREAWLFFDMGSTVMNETPALLLLFPPLTF